MVADVELLHHGLFRDDRGNPIRVGDTVCLTMRDSDRGAYGWMWKGVVVGFGRTRVKVQFPSRADVSTVGGECLRVCDAQVVANPQVGRVRT